MATSNKIIETMFSWASGWLSDNKFTWIAWSFQESKNIEVRKDARTITLTKSLQKDSGSVVTDTITTFLSLSTGDLMAFWETWAIYRKYSWAWHKNSTSIGQKIISAIEYNWYVYFTTFSSLYRVAIWSISNSMTFTVYKTFENGSDYHPMIVFSNTNLYIWDKDYIALIDYPWIWYEKILVLSKNLVCKSIQAISSSLKFYCEYAQSLNSSEIVYWSWIEWVLPSESITINGVNPSHILNMNGYDYVIANNRLWILDWYKQQKLKDITDFSTNSNSISILDNKLTYWWTGGIWVWWALNKNYPEVLSFDHSTSNSETDTVWALWFHQWELYVSWSNWSTHWIDRLTTDYNTTWYLLTRVYFWNLRYSIKKAEQMFISFKELLENESITVYARTDLTDFELVKTYEIWAVYEALHRDHRKLELKQFNFIEFKFELTGDWTTSPELYEVLMSYEPTNPIK